MSALLVKSRVGEQTNLMQFVSPLLIIIKQQAKHSNNQHTIQSKQIRIVFIRFIINLMANRRYLDEREKHFDNYASKPLDNYHSDAPRSRASLNIPEFSLVRETDQHNLSNAEELSLLDKLATERDKVFTSKVVEEKPEEKRSELTTNEMKFSFNRNYAAEDGAKPQFQPLSQQVDAEKELQNRGKDFLLGSIRRNKYEVNGSKLNHTKREAFEKKAVQQQSNATSIMKTYLNKQKFESKQQYSKIDNYSSYKETRKSSPKKDTTFIKQLPSFTIQTSEISNQPEVPSQNDQTEIAHYLSVLFDKLDSSKTGLLTKQNCFIQIIREEFKYVFGLVFSLIFIKDMPHNRVDFTRQCINALNALKSPQIYKSLRDLDPLYHSNILKKRNGFTFLLNRNLHDDRSSLQERRANTNFLHETQTEGKTQKRSVSKYSSNIQTDRQVSLSNAFYKLQISPEIDRFQAELSRKMQLEAINRQPYVTLQETRYNNNSTLSQNTQLNTTPTQFQTTPIRALQDSLALQETTRTIKETLHSRLDSYSITQKENIFEVQGSKKKKLRNISQQILREHKRSLQELLKLNEKMETYLYRQVGQAQLTPHLFSPTRLREL